MPKLSKWLSGPLTVTPAEEYGLFRVEEIADAEDGKQSTDKAISQLFSAAPDLLAVLEEFVEDIETSYQHGDEYPDGDALEMLRVEWPDLAITYEKAVKSIALAKGA